MENIFSFSFTRRGVAEKRAPGETVCLNRSFCGHEGIKCGESYKSSPFTCTVLAVLKCSYIRRRKSFLKLSNSDTHLHHARYILAPGGIKKALFLFLTCSFLERVLTTAGSKVPGAPARDTQNPFFILFHHPLTMSSRTNHFSDVASVCLATVHPNYHFCWDIMNHL